MCVYDLSRFLTLRLFLKMNALGIFFSCSSQDESRPQGSIYAPNLQKC